MTPNQTAKQSCIPYNHNTLAKSLNPFFPRMTYRLLTLRVAVFGDRSEEKTLTLLWFRQTKTMYEFYAGQRSLRSCRTEVAWFPSAVESPDDLFAFFQGLPGCLVMRYIGAPEHIVGWRFQDCGLSKFSYMDTFADTSATRTTLRDTFQGETTRAARRIQRAWRLHFLKSL